VRRVTFVQQRLPHYRVPFFEALRTALRDLDLELTLLHGTPSPADASRQDSGRLAWATTVDTRRIGALGGAVWQPVLTATRDADLIVTEQATKLIANQLLLARRAVVNRSPLLAFWGHGANLQAAGSLRARGLERWKRHYSTRVDWWFAYTAGSAQRVRRLGFPADRITVVQNAIGVPPRTEGTEREPATCVFVGSLYREKRIPQLLEAGRLLAERIPRFRLVVVGDGPDRDLVTAAAHMQPWLDYRGALSEPEVSRVVERSAALLMPGLVGLVAINSFASGTPIVTCRDAPHSPEFEYLVDGRNALIVDGGLPEYVEAVVRLLTSKELAATLSSGCVDSAAVYTLDAMVDRFTTGIDDALSAGRRSRSD
jgi:glycosyltransferase involved in cell wall biosynthesis